MYQKVFSTKEDVVTKKTTVAGIIEQKTKKSMDKDGDGKIMVSEYYTLSEGEVLQRILAVDSKSLKKTFMLGQSICILLFWRIWIRMILLFCVDLRVIIYVKDM